ncbi:MAG: hypothetical protein GX117_13340 [Candidatus Hydrogenedentes bacterium]|nr:hypothetical protein [Candidatus Hydrogenedentota bacterium]
MKGQVLDYSTQENSGLISGADGSRYPFAGSEWKGDTPPSRGMQVDFDVQDGSAVAIYQSLGGVASVVGAAAGNRSKEFGKAAMTGSMNVLIGRSETSALKFLVIGFRIMGVLTFLAAVLEMWFFEWISIGMRMTSDSSHFVVWLKVCGLGLVLGGLIYGLGELISLFQKMESHLRKLAEKA